MCVRQVSNEDGEPVFYDPEIDHAGPPLKHGGQFVVEQTGEICEILVRGIGIGEVVVYNPEEWKIAYAAVLYTPPANERPSAASSKPHYGMGEKDALYGLQVPQSLTPFGSA